MPSMACLILQAAARVSTSVASAAYRFAAATRAAAAAAAARSGSGGAAARSGSGSAAASDPLKHSSSVAAAGSPASSRCRLSPHDSIAQLQAVVDGSPFVQPDWAKFEANEKDLQSDDALWDLYERWCKFFNQERDREEMARRFSYFKDTVPKVEENKKSDLPYILGINKFADGKQIELYCKNSAMNYVRRPRSASPIYGSEVGFLFNKDPAAYEGPSQVGRVAGYRN